MELADSKSDGAGTTIPFTQALKDGDLCAIQRAPKADFHRHAFFGTRIENVERWLGYPLERPALPMPGLKAMDDYAARVLGPHISSREAFEFTAAAAIGDAIEDGVRCLEMSFDVRSASHFASGFAEFASTIQNLTERFRDRIDLRPELGIPREMVGDQGDGPSHPRWNRVRRLPVDRPLCRRKRVFCRRRDSHLQECKFSRNEIEGARWRIWRGRKHTGDDGSPGAGRDTTRDRGC